MHQTTGSILSLVDGRCVQNGHDFSEICPETFHHKWVDAHIALQKVWLSQKLRRQKFEKVPRIPIMKIKMNTIRDRALTEENCEYEYVN